MLTLFCCLIVLFLFFLFFEEDAICEVLGRASSSESLCHITLDFFIGGGVLPVSLPVSSLTVSSSSISLSLRLAVDNLTGEPIETDCSDLHNPSM